MFIRDGLSVSFGFALKKRYVQITQCRFTLLFFLLALASTITQTVLESLALDATSRSQDLVSTIIDATPVRRGFPIVSGDVVQICYGIPTLTGVPCDVVFNGTAGEVASLNASLASRAVSVVPFVNGSDFQGVIVSPSSTSPTALSLSCVQSLTWLEAFLRDAKSEDVVHIILQSWLFTVSLAALLVESIPHLIVVIVSHGVNTGWALFRVCTDLSARNTYQNVIVDGPCGGVDVLGGWSGDSFRYAMIGINAIVFLVMTVSGYKLIRVYRRETFGSVGAPPVVSRVLMFSHCFLVSIQLSSFYIMAAAAVWYDKRKTGIVPPYSQSTLSDAAFIVVAMLLPPWFWLGLYSIQREIRRLFLVFCAISIAFVVISGLWFNSALYRYELGDWTFLGALASTAYFLLGVTCAIAVVCRMHFGLGLAQFLKVQAALQKAGFTQDRFIIDPGTATPNLSRTDSLMLGNGTRIHGASRLSTRGSVSSVRSLGTFEMWLKATNLPNSESRCDIEHGNGDEAQHTACVATPSSPRPGLKPLMLVSSRDSASLTSAMDAQSNCSTACGSVIVIGKVDV